MSTEIWGVNVLGNQGVNVDNDFAILANDEKDDVIVRINQAELTGAEFEELKDIARTKGKVYKSGKGISIVDDTVYDAIKVGDTLTNVYLNSSKNILSTLYILNKLNWSAITPTYDATTETYSKIINLIQTSTKTINVVYIYTTDLSTAIYLIMNTTGILFCSAPYQTYEAGWYADSAVIDGIVTAVDAEQEIWKSLISKKSFKASIAIDETVTATVEALNDEINARIEAVAAEANIREEQDNILSASINAIISSIGQPNGIAALGEDGKVPSSQLPSYVDDVVEGYYYNNKFYKDESHTEEIPGEKGKIYIDLISNVSYRWGGTTFIAISVNNYNSLKNIPIVNTDLSMDGFSPSTNTYYRHTGVESLFKAGVIYRCVSISPIKYEEICRQVDEIVTSSSENLITSGAVYTMGESLQNADANLQANISTEANTRMLSDSSLQANIDSEIINRQNADNNLQLNINVLASGLSNEITNREVADTNLQININTIANDLSNESIVRQSSDLAIQSNIESLSAVLANKQNTIDANNKLSASFVSGLATVATNGSYNDLSDKPTIFDPNTAEVAIGNGATATGRYTTAIGDHAYADGYGATSLGYGANAYLDDSIAIGRWAKSLSADSITLGTCSVTHNAYSIAVGINATTSNFNTIAIGVNSSVSGNNSISIGYKTKSQYTDSIAFGREANANAGAISIGSRTNANMSALSIGYSANASGENSISLGSYANTTADRAVQIGKGTNLNANSLQFLNTVVVDSNGKINADTAKSVAASNVSGLATVATSGNYNDLSDKPTIFDPNTTKVKVGRNAVANGLYSTAIGPYANAYGNESAALSHGANAIGVRSTAIGAFTNAIGNFSTALGYNANSSGGNSISFGQSTKASGENSIAIGGSTNAYGENSTAIGVYAIASATNAVQIGGGENLNANSLQFLNTVVVDSNGKINADTAKSVAASNVSGLATVATSGNYNDLSDKPTIPTVDVNKSYVDTELAKKQATIDANNKLSASFLSGLATVATNGSYNDLSNKPTIFDPNTTEVAIGYASNATGHNSTSIGFAARANNNESTALGYWAKASGHNSTALGSEANASGKYSVALCYRASASNDQAIAIGFCSESSGNSAIALGYSSNASGHGAIALGVTTNAGDHSAAFGYCANASGVESIALGYSADASGSRSAALGYDANASGVESIALGYFANASGNYSATLGPHANAYGNDSIALGYGAIAAGNNSTALGYRANASNEISTALGCGANALGETSIAIGARSNSSGLLSISIGVDSAASNGNSISLGRSASASGEGSITVGYVASAKDVESIAIGKWATASNNESIALGSTSKANGEQSIAIGAAANISSNYSVALGSYTEVVNSENSTALGSRSQIVNENNVMKLGSVNLSALKCQVALTVVSDERDKINIQPITNALNFINKIEPITYVRNDRENYVISDENISSITNTGTLLGGRMYDKDEHSKGSKSGLRRRAGVKAQQVNNILKETYGTDNYADIVCDNLIDNPSDDKNTESQLGVNYEKLIPFLIRAIQEQQVEIEELKSKIK